jgi:hypothetical protein
LYTYKEIEDRNEILKEEKKDKKQKATVTVWIWPLKLYMCMSVLLYIYDKYLIFCLISKFKMYV